METHEEPKYTMYVKVQTQTYANGPLISRKEIQGHVYLTTDHVYTP